MHPRATLLLLSLLLSGCRLPAPATTRAAATPKNRDEKLLRIKRPAMAEPVILDVVALPEDKYPTMWDIAQTFPAYDWSINAFHRDGLTVEDEDSFLLKGDRSQMPVEIQQIADAKPLKVELTIGPIHDGFGFRKPMLHYTFKRVKGGWKRTQWHVTYHGPSTGEGTHAPALSEEENRARIEQITGKPYVDETEVEPPSGTVASLSSPPST